MIILYKSLHWNQAFIYNIASIVCFFYHISYFNLRQQSEHSSQKIAKETMSYLKQLKFLEGDSREEKVLACG